MNSNYTNYIFIIIALCMFSLGCNIINPAEKNATYVRVDSVGFVAGNYNITGTSSHAITTVWAYYNNKALGVFDLPANIPVIASGKGTLTFIPGISISGVKGTQAQYPYYISDTATLQAQEGKIVTVYPKTSYVSSTKFLWMEDFENGTTFITDHSYGDTGIVVTREAGTIFEGSASGIMFMKSATDTGWAISTTGTAIPSGQPYLELDYKCNTTFYVGIKPYISSGVESNVYWISGVRATKKSSSGDINWNKLYISLSQVVADYNTYNVSGNVVKYYVVIRSSVDNGEQTGYVLLDNLKITSF